jgi:hypothetical protein
MAAVPATASKILVSFAISLRGQRARARGKKRGLTWILSIPVTIGSPPVGSTIQTLTVASAAPVAKKLVPGAIAMQLIDP